MPVAEPRSNADNLRGAGWMTLGMLGYVVNDAFIKLAAEDLPLFQSIFIRGCFISCWMLLIAGQRGELREAQSHLDRALGVRVAMEALGTAFYLSALTRAPLAGLTAVLQIVPLVVTFAAARVLRERVDWPRVLSVLIGFGGVLLIIRPGSSDFNPWFLMGLVVVATIVVRELATTNISTLIPTSVVSLTTAVTITAMGFVGSFIEGWRMPNAGELLLLLGASGFLTLGYIGSVVTIRVGDISFSAPFRYTILVFAIVLQILVFRDIPDALTFLGAGIITAAGLYAVRNRPTTQDDLAPSTSAS